jgi:O-antigen/teichoic acid export membrane protein
MPESTHIEYNVVRSIVGFGFAFFIIQIGMSLGSASDNLLITNVLGPEASAAFAIPQKMYGAVSIIVMMSILPLWPAYGEAIAVGDNRWVVFTLWRSLVTSVVFATIASVVLTIFAQRIMFVWTGVNLQVGIDLFVALCIWQIVLTAGNAIAMFVNGTSYLVARQAYISVIAGAAMIAGKYFALREIGMSGVVWGGIGAYVLFSGIPTGYLVYRAIEQLKRGKVGESTGSRALVA